MDCSSSSSSIPCVIYISDGRITPRNGFTSYLINDLKLEGSELGKKKGVEIKCCNEDTITTGHDRESEIKKMITDSFIGIAIISESYVTENCLKELLMLREQCVQEGKNFLLLPVFYLVSPENVRNLEGNFGKKFRELIKKFKESESVWKDALSKTSDIVGHVVMPKENQANIVKLIVRDVLSHVTDLFTRGIIRATPSEKSSSVEATVEYSRESVEENKESVCCTRNQGECTKIEGSEIQILPPLRPGFVDSLRKLASGHLTSCICDETRLRSAGCTIMGSSERKFSKETICEALRKVATMFSCPLELFTSNLEDMDDSLQILKSLDENDGLTTTEKIILSTLQPDVERLVERKHKAAEGKKEVCLRIEKRCQLIAKVNELLEQFDRRHEKLVLNFHACKKEEQSADSSEAILRGLVLIDKEETLKQENLCHTLRSYDLELNVLRRANLDVQESEIEEYRQEAIREWDNLKDWTVRLWQSFSSD